MTKLTLVPANSNAPQAAASYEVSPGLAVVIGREVGCDIKIDEAQEMVSRRHVTLRLDEDSLVAVDSSSNGLFVNGERAAGSRRIEDEDTLQLGPGGPSFAIALDPKPPKKPAPAKATRLYTSAAASTVDTRPQPLAAEKPGWRMSAEGAPKVSQGAEAVKQANAVQGNAYRPSMDDATAYLDKAQGSVIQAHGWLTQVFTHPVVFVLVYLFFMLLTYYLPYLGSNSGVAAVAYAATETVNKPFWAHLFSLSMLVGATWYRGNVIGKSWIMIFPIIAAVFDLAPLLNWIPLIPTAMHLAALIMGVRGRTG